MKKKKKSIEDFLPYERPGESFYEKESRQADAILARERARNKRSKSSKARKRISRDLKRG
jgi:hypothetical protein